MEAPKVYWEPPYVFYYHNTMLRPGEYLAYFSFFCLLSTIAIILVLYVLFGAVEYVVGFVFPWIASGVYGIWLERKGDPHTPNV